MLCLGIDTAAAECAVALWSSERGSLAGHHEALARGQAERLLPMILECLAAAGTALEAVDRIGVAVGPGAFTGLRVGLAAARGLALGGVKELVGITSFEATAAAVGPEGAAGLLVLRESRREDFYAQGFAADLTPLAPAEACLPADLPALCRRLFGTAPLRLGGDGAPRAALFLPGLTLCPEPPGALAAAVARLAGECAAERIAARPANPFYLRAPDTTAPAGTGG